MIKKIKKETKWKDKDILKITEEAQVRLKIKKRGEKKEIEND